MPPAKSSRNHDDKADTPNSKEKGGNGHTSTKMRRNASQQNHSHLREVQNATAAAPPQPPAEPSPPSLHWASFDRDVLHAYRREHRLNTPSSFSSPYCQWILSQPNGIGIHSPTMVRRRQARRQSKDQLALAVRKHFNGMGVQENDVIVDFIYKIRHEPSRISKPHTGGKTPTLAK
ncbi:uncharacterized protein FSUBG_5150 [Fusarium subglutinans]|uniref:Histone deacetylase complex subunit SAP30 Sin3 binding domain-containing protein n=2 Tax=Fusarium fujikuroi species complex TaxID=171627 RepID=A0A8H5Q404_GIBSU|nr:uncharacterized protein FSUBG_5150 [Fusarium subglutinans]KAF5554882.1 hypothetical protein FMEXI_1860 [Fusarium mexicanum]KAF5607612.1 hypothetical protein FSUBG_5150 [Fusarium subglutinans]